MSTSEGREDSKNHSRGRGTLTDFQALVFPDETGLLRVAIKDVTDGKPAIQAPSSKWARMIGSAAERLGP